MDSGRQTRRKSYPQTTSFQPSRASKDKQTPQEKTTAPISPNAVSANTTEKKLSTAKSTKKSNQIPLENTPTELSTPEVMSEVPKQAGNIGTMHKEESNKTPSHIKRDRKYSDSAYSDDVSEETKKQIEMLFEIAQSSASKGDYNQAINIYNKIVKLNEKSTPAWIAIGHCYAMLGDNYKALSSYQQALSITPDSQKDDQLWYGIGLLYQKIEDWKNAETSFKNALRLNPNSAIKGEILYNLGMMMKTRGDPKEGARMLMNSILLGSFSVDKMVDILCAVGQAQEELEEVNEAMKAYKHALTLDDNNLRALQCAGWLCFQLDKTNEALDYLTKASLINEEDNNILFMRARCYLKLKQHSKAYDSLHICLNRDSLNSMYWCSLGILFAEMSQLKSAHECFSNALKFNPRSAENYFNLGCLYELCGQLTDAITMHEKAIELQPKFQLAYTRKLGVYAQLENKDNNHLEVQFKHQKFTLTWDKQTENKHVFQFPQPGQSEMLTSSEKKGSNYNAEEESFNLQHHENRGITNSGNKSQISKQQQKPNQKPRDDHASFLTSQIANSAQKNMLFQNPLSSELSNTPLLKLQETHGDSSKGKQNINNSVNLGNIPTLKESSNYTMKANENAGSSRVSPTGNKAEESKANPNEKPSKDDGILLEKNHINEGNKINKNSIQPIVLKHDPQVLQGKDEIPKIDSLSSGNKSQPKSGFKLAHKIQRGDDEELGPQKKLKMDAIGTANNGSPNNEKQESGTKKISSSIITPSASKN